jgi:deoxyribodipyrimidine photo-lyase
MQASQRVEENHALELAKEIADDLSLPLVVLFVLFKEYPSANSRSFTFMIEDLLEVFESLEEADISFLAIEGEPVESVTLVTSEASVLVTDAGYLRHQTDWREALAEKVD